MAAARAPKGENAFRTISEAAEAVGAPQHVLRFWETKFSFLAPLKRAGGRRFYRPQDVVLLKAVKRLLHDEGLTIKGVQRLHKEQGLRRLAAYGDPDATVSFADDADVAPSATGADSDPADRLQEILAQLEAARSRLDAVLSR
jgi:DNA-binding transcriptional MerR regulator